MASISRHELKRRLQNMDEYEFEELVADVWEAQGWETTVTTGAADRGIDVIATRHDPFTQKQLIQAKRYSEGTTVGSPDIQQYASLRQQEENVDAVVVVTTSGFSSQAESVAHDLNVKLISGDKLCHLIEKYDLVQEYFHVSDKKPIAESTETTTITEDSSATKTRTKSQSNKYGTPGAHLIVALFTIWWTYGLGNLFYAAYKAAQTNESDFSDFSKIWYYGVIVGLALWTEIGIEILLNIERQPGIMILIWGALILTSVSIYFDTKYIQANSNWNPSTRGWVFAMLIPIVNIPAGIGYVIQRRKKISS